MKVMHYKKFKGIVVFFSLSLFCSAQDIHFSQFFAMPIFVNPANAGVENDLDIGVIHRTQWKAVSRLTQDGDTKFGEGGISERVGMEISGHNTR